MTPLARRATTALTSLLVASAGLVATSPAQAGPTQVTGASFAWGLNGYAQKGVFDPPVPWRLFDFGGSATLLKGSVSGGTQTTYAVEPVPSTSMPASNPQKSPNAVYFTGGTGTADTATGELSLSWTGTYTVNAYPASFNFPDEIYSDPELSVDTTGAGALTMDVTIGEGIDRDGAPVPPVDLGRLTVLTFSDGARASAGDTYRLTPDYQGVEVETSSGPQRRDCGTGGGATGWWGSWPVTFVNAMPESVRPHFYSTGCAGLQDNKPALPVDVDLAPLALSSVSAAAPAKKFGQVATATVAVSSGGTNSGTVRLTGLGAARTATVANGRATFALGTPTAKVYTLTATYSGDGTTSSSTTTTVLRVTKATTTTAAKVTVKPTTRKAGKLAVTLTSPTTTPAGKVKVVLKKGARTVKTVTATLKARKAVVMLPKAAKGAYRAVVTYAGNADVAGSSRTAAYRITK